MTTKMKKLLGWLSGNTYHTVVTKADGNSHDAPADCQPISPPLKKAVPIAISRSATVLEKEEVPVFETPLLPHYPLKVPFCEPSKDPAHTEPLVLYCTVQRNARHVNFCWMKDEEPIRVDERVKLISQNTATQLQISQSCMKDCGRYTCRAHNHMGSSQTTTFVYPNPEVGNNGNKHVLHHDVSTHQNIAQASARLPERYNRFNEFSDPTDRLITVPKDIVAQKALEDRNGKTPNQWESENFTDVSELPECDQPSPENTISENWPVPFVPLLVNCQSSYDNVDYLRENEDHLIPIKMMFSYLPPRHRPPFGQLDQVMTGLATTEDSESSTTINNDQQKRTLGGQKYLFDCGSCNDRFHETKINNVLGLHKTVNTREFLSRTEIGGTVSRTQLFSSQRSQFSRQKHKGESMRCASVQWSSMVAYRRCSDPTSRISSSENDVLSRINDVKTLTNLQEEDIKKLSLGTHDCKNCIAFLTGRKLSCPESQNKVIVILQTNGKYTTETIEPLGKQVVTGTQDLLPGGLNTVKEKQDNPTNECAEKNARKINLELLTSEVESRNTFRNRSVENDSNGDHGVGLNGYKPIQESFTSNNAEVIPQTPSSPEYTPTLEGIQTKIPKDSPAILSNFRHFWSSLLFKNRPVQDNALRSTATEVPPLQKRMKSYDAITSKEIQTSVHLTREYGSTFGSLDIERESQWSAQYKREGDLFKTNVENHYIAVQDDSAVLNKSREMSNTDLPNCDQCLSQENNSFTKATDGEIYNNNTDNEIVPWSEKNHIRKLNIFGIGNGIPSQTNEVQLNSVSNLNEDLHKDGVKEMQRYTLSVDTITRSPSISKANNLRINDQVDADTKRTIVSEDYNDMDYFRLPVNRRVALFLQRTQQQNLSSSELSHQGRLKVLQRQQAIWQSTDDTKKLPIVDNSVAKLLINDKNEDYVDNSFFNSSTTKTVDQGEEVSCMNIQDQSNDSPYSIKIISIQEPIKKRPALDPTLVNCNLKMEQSRIMSPEPVAETLSTDLQEQVTRISNSNALFSIRESFYGTRLSTKSPATTALSGNRCASTETPACAHTENNEGKSECAVVQPAETYHNINPELHYKTLSTLGKGKFGTVIKCQELQTGRVFASKSIRTCRLQRANNDIMEVAVMRAIGRHPQIAYLHAAYEYNGRCTLLIEHVAGGSLNERIDKEGYLDEAVTVTVVKQILQGLQHLEACHVLHCDLKPENLVMVDLQGYRLKIIDFGLAYFYKTSQVTGRPAGTLTYIAPETQNCDPQSYATDIWSVAVIAYEILSGITPFEVPQDGGDPNRKLSKHEISLNITQVQYTFEEDGIADASEEAKEFIQKIFVRDPKLRPNATECLEHRWITTPSNKLSRVLRKVSLIRHLSNRRPNKPPVVIPKRAMSLRSRERPSIDDLN